MRKAAVALGTVGIGAGILYAFGRTRENREKLRAIEDREKVEGGVENQAPNLARSRSISEAMTDSKLGSMSPLNDVSSVEGAERDFAIDDRGTDQVEASQILMKIRDEKFDSSDEKLAVALGRPVAEIQAWMRGERLIDSDVLMKARALALERG